jgi:hypothetical protein
MVGLLVVAPRIPGGRESGDLAPLAGEVAAKHLL